MSDRGLRLLQAVARRLLGSWYAVEVRGGVPDGPAVVAANHLGFLDGPLMAAFAPRPLRALTKREMFAGPAAPLLRLAGQIPVTRHVPDPGAVRTALRVLRAGGLVGVFPEGTRGAGAVLRAEGGAAYLAMVAGVPVVPLAFLGTREPGGRLNSVPPRGTRLVMAYAEPLDLGHVPWPRTRDVVRRETERVRTALAELVGETTRTTGIGLPGPVPDPDHEEML